jgi:hypothetical protein
MEEGMNLNQVGRVVLVLGMTAGAFAQDGSADRAKDRRDIRHDQRDVNHDKRDIRNDVKNGQYKNAQKDIRDLRHDRRDRNHDVRDLRHDRQGK